MSYRIEDFSLNDEHQSPKRDRIYKIFSVIASLLVIGIFLFVVSSLPRFGDESAPPNNEVAKEYVEKGTENTNAVNTVAAMILEYRGFDTFGESTVLFVGTIGVISLIYKPFISDEEEHSNETA